jgi:chromosome segregation ATPase
MADCPHIVSSREGTHYCDLAKQSVDTLTAELTALRAERDAIKAKLEERLLRTERDSLRARVAEHENCPYHSKLPDGRTAHQACLEALSLATKRADEAESRVAELERGECPHREIQWSATHWMPLPSPPSEEKKA